METNSKSHNKKGSIIEQQLKGIPFKKLSKQSGFCKRKPKKIGPKNIVVSFLLTIWGSKENTYSSWASKLGLLINDTVSKQALSKRVTSELVEFLKKILQAVIKKSVHLNKKDNISEKLKQFKRILIEDSTNIHLHDKLSKQYPGSRNHKGKEYATMKIQTVYEVIRRRFLRFEITNFRENDQSYAAKIIEIVKPGDLVIRDLGYFVTEVFKRLNQKSVNFVSRLTKAVNIYHKEEEKVIDLAKMLKRRGSLDMEVFIGVNNRIPVRLIAIPVEEHEASERRRKAKASLDHGHKMRKKNLFLLGWTLLITNIPKEQMGSGEVAKIYSVRWRIEIIFKTWKSFLEIKNIPQDANKIRLEAFIYCMLIFIILFQVHYYIYYSGRLSKKEVQNKEVNISLMKFMQYVVSNIALNIYTNYFSHRCNIDYLFKKQINYYCLYEKRLDRINYAQLLQN